MPVPDARARLLATIGSHPRRRALRAAGGSWTYGEIDIAARRWARALLEACGSQPRRIAVFGPGGFTAQVGVAAALYAGATAVPLSPNLPSERTAEMLRVADVDAVIADPPHADDLPALPQEVPVVADEPAGDALEDLPEIRAGDPAYLLFTSGSTGTPKGVPISHANVAHLLESSLHRFRLEPADRIAQTFEPTFDLSLFTLFLAWSSGAGVSVLEPIELLSPYRRLDAEAVTIWFSVPSVAALLARGGHLTPGSLPSLRLSLFCGEALPVNIAEAWAEAAPSSVLENLYGPTECTMACTAYRWDRAGPNTAPGGLVPIGRPFPGVEVLVIDDADRPAPEGTAGELCIGGTQTFDGYWRDEAATERAFVTVQGRSFYRTGDRALVTPGGELAFLGRSDHQVKVLGHRLDLGEVEAVLREAPGVSEAIAVPSDLASGTASAIEAVVTGTDVDGAALIASARRRLPSAVVPRRVVVAPELPRGPHGKVDRTAVARLLEG